MLFRSELISDLKKLGYKNKELKRENHILTEEKKRFQNEKNDLIKESIKLKEKINKLKPIINKFTLNSEKLYMLLNDQRVSFNKIGLRFNPLRK